MKTFERNYKINFVDDNNVLVGFDNDQSCCENFGHFLSRKIPTSIDEGGEDLDAEGFNFDTSFFQQKPLDEEYPDEGGMVIFRLTKADEEIFLTLYNSHNGFYSHGFDMEVCGVKIHDSAL